MSEIYVLSYDNPLVKGTASDDRISSSKYAATIYGYAGMMK